MIRRALAVTTGALVAVVSLALNGPVIAHRSAVSPFTFHRDVVPILESRCGRCHLANSATGLPLLQYGPARAATWPMRQALAGGHMPPWFAEGEFKSPAPLTARELNVLMTWATGGAPEGRAESRLPRASAEWPLGPPDLILPMPAPFTFDETRNEVVHEVTISAAKLRGRSIRFVDLNPGTPAIVRRAEVIMRTGGSEQTLALWQPGDEPVMFEANAAFRVLANSAIKLRMHYRKQFNQPESDRSRLGVYFAKSGSVAIQSLELMVNGNQATTAPINRRMRAVAVRASGGAAGAWLRLVLIHADGTRQSLAKIQLNDDWSRRYVFRTPPFLPAGSRLEGRVTDSESPLWTSLTAEKSSPETPVRAVVEVVP